jgi:RNA polymerase sigma-70 factor (ECF subfamily)
VALVDELPRLGIRALIEEYGTNRIGQEPAPVALASARPHAGMPGAGQASDEALMISYRDGDAAAFHTLYARHRGGLYRFLLRQCGAAALAEELFQDVWLNVIRSRRRYAPQARFATYLYRIAHNRLIDHYRRNARRPLERAQTDDEDGMQELPGDPREQPENSHERRVAVQRLLDLLARLPDAQREAFVMHEEGGLSVEEIAAATGVNAETAKSRLRYALAKLRSGLRELL